MQPFILLPVHALWPNDILEHGHADTVAPCEITAIINPEKDSSLITKSHKRHSHKTQNTVSLAHLKKRCQTLLWRGAEFNFQEIQWSHKNTSWTCNLLPLFKPQCRLPKSHLSGFTKLIYLLWLVGSNLKIHHSWWMFARLHERVTEYLLQMQFEAVPGSRPVIIIQWYLLKTRTNKYLCY